MAPSTIYITPDKGYVNATPFSFNLNTSLLLAPLSSYKSFLWNFGDGEVSRIVEPTHIYKYPKEYTITLNAYKDDGNYDVYTQQLNVSLYINESIYFENVPPPTFTSHYNKYPFKINITSSTVGKHTIDLSTQFSKSYKNQTPRNKWSFLRPEWKFLDLNGNIIESIDTTDTEIKINAYGKIVPDGTTVGVTGTAQFYLVDDLYNVDLVSDKLAYTTIIATLQTSGVNSFHDSFNADKNLPSFSNSKAIAIMPHIFLWRYPDYIEITENGLDDMIKNRWSYAQHPLIVKFAYDKNPSFNDIHGNGVKLYNELTNFCHYVPYNSSYNQNLSFSVVGLSSNIEPKPTTVYYFNPKTNFIESGYYKGSMEVEKISALDVSISAFANIKTPNDLVSNFINPILWISNPAAGMAAAINYFYEPWVDSLSTKNLNNAHIKIFDIPVINPITQNTFVMDNHALSGFHGVYSIASLPAPYFQAWMADGEQDMLYKVTTQGEIVSSINLNDLYYDKNFNFLVQKKFAGQLSPATISLDGDQNLWVTLYDTFSALKFDKNGNFLFNTSPINSIGYNITGDNARFRDLFKDHANALSNNSDYDNNLIEPTCVECDIDDNVWISYSSPLSGWVIKYDKNGNLLNQIPYPINTNPKEIKTDENGYVWIVGNEFKLTPEHKLVPPNPAKLLTGFIEKRDTNGNLLSSFGPFNNISHLTLDINENPWFTYSYHWVGTINNQTGRQYSIKTTTENYSDNVPDWFDPNENADETALEGIASDARGNIYVIQSIENKIIVIDSSTIKIKDRFNLNPKGFVFSNVNYDEDGHTKLEYNLWSKSAQAQGDWTGFRWTKKYGKDKLKFLFDGLTSRNLSGIEVNLNFYTQNPFDFFKKNENFDFSNNMKELAFQPNLRNSQFLFDEFFGSIFGKYPFKHDDIGTSSYEKISNFISNKNDIDTCDVNSIYDISNMVDLNTDDFKLNFPKEIRRVMDQLSVNQSKLWGGLLKDEFNFKKRNEDGNYNRGDILDTKTYKVTAGIPIILNTKSLKNFKLIQTGFIDINNNTITNTTPLVTALSTYPLSSLAYILNLGEYWDQFYEFFEYKPSEYQIECDGLIDWESSQTLLNKQLSTSNDWFKDEGIVETIFSYELYKGLGLLKE